MRYCGCRSISLVGRFMDEHEDIVNAAGILHRASDGTDSHGVRESLEDTITLLHPHTTAEEQGMFAVLRRNPDFTDHVDVLCAEHAALDEMAERIRSGETGLIDRFVSELRDHINKERTACSPPRPSRWTAPTGRRPSPSPPAGSPIPTGPRPRPRGRPHVHAPEHAYGADHDHAAHTN